MSALLPFFGMLQRRGLSVTQVEAGVGIAALARAVRRCALCRGKALCGSALASGAGGDPVADGVVYCPNAALLRRTYDAPVR